MRYTYVRQQDATDCAAACLAMICLHYKKETTITKLRDMMGTDIKGTNLYGLNECSKKLGFMSQAINVDKEGFLSKYTLPAIANIVTKEGMGHFVVVFKITKRYVVIGDPARNLIRITIDEFLETFTGAMLILMPDDNFETGKESHPKMISRFMQLLLPHKKLFFYSILCSVILSGLGIVSSLFNKIIMDEILPYKLENVLLVVLLIFAFISLIQIVIGYLRQWIMIYLSQKIDIPLMLGYFKHIYSLPMKFFSTRKTGDIITRYSDGVTIKSIFTNIAMTLVLDISMALITGVILAQMNSKLFFVIAVIMIINIFLVFIFRQPYKQINYAQMHQASVLNSQLIEGLRGIETIKANACEQVELEQIEREYIRSLRIGRKEGMLSNLQNSINGFVSTVGNLVLMYFGVIQVLHNEISLGSLMAFTTLSGYFMNPIGRLIGLQLQIQEANISMKRIAEILDYEVENMSADSDKGENDKQQLLYDQKEHNVFRELKRVEGNIEFRDVTFSYGNRKPALEHINFTIPEGKKVAFVGASGSGKSTIAKLLLKYYDLERGEIQINGINIKEFKNQDIRKAIAYVPQTIELFSRTILDNIKIGNPDASYEEVVKAAKLAEADEFIDQLPRKYFNYLEEAGNGLSGGEKQRVALARAFLKDSSLFILDESTSSLDFGTESLIFDMIFHKFKEKTMLIIAHRLATIKNCDEIMVLDGGKIIERGNHEELLAKKGKYYELWEMQQGNYQIKNQLHKSEEKDEITEGRDDSLLNKKEEVAEV